MDQSDGDKQQLLFVLSPRKSIDCAEKTAAIPSKNDNDYNTKFKCRRMKL